MKRIALGLVLGLSLGFAAGRFLWSTTDGSPPKGGSGFDDATPKPTLRASTVPVEEPAPASVVAAATTPVPEGALADLFRALPEYEELRGNGIVGGRVRTSDGVPLGGVRIALIPIWGPRGVHTPPEGEESAAAFVSRSAAIRLWRDRSTRRAETADDGSYEVVGLGAGRYTLVARAPGYVVEPSEPLGEVSAGGIAHFVATPLVPLVVDIRHPDGSQLDAATITAERGERREVRIESGEWTRANPEIRLPRGPYRIFASVGRPMTAASEEVMVDLGAGARPPLRLVVFPSCTVIARFLAPPHEPVASALVALVKGVPARPLNPRFVYATGNSRTLHGTVDEAVFERIVPGRYTVVAVREDRSGDVGSVAVEVAPGTNRVDVPIPPRDRTLAVWVQMTDADGRPVEDVRFRADDRAGSGSQGVSVLGSNDGRYVILPELPPEFPAERQPSAGIEIEVIAEHPKFAAKSFPVRFGVDRELRIAFAPKGGAEPKRR